ncbi:MAG: bifunctional serine/threonine-protein kinase/formylglycine-generating enzyme family protein [Planctomycetota bacterium]
MIRVQSDEADALQLFWSAVDLPLSERRDYLLRHCAQRPALRDRLDRLLRAFESSEKNTSHGSIPEFLSWLDSGGAAERRAQRAPIPERIERYQLLQPLGAGGMGVVYLAEDVDTRRRVAIKILNPGIDPKRAAQRFELEGALLARLRHPGVAQVYEAGETSGGLFFMALEYVEGQTLGAYRTEHSLTVAQRVALAAQICEILEHAHQRGVIHRDLKPANILVSGPPDRPSVKIIDFGLAKLIDSSAQVRPFATVVGHIVGTLAYMSPEQAAGHGEVDLRTDVYALGVILGELLTGQVPPIESTRAAHDYLDRLDRADLDRPLRPIVEHAVAPDRADRYPSCRELAADLHRYLVGEPVEVGPQPWIQRWRRFHRRYRSVVWPVAITFAALLACSLTFFGLWRSKEHALTLARDSWERQTDARLEAEARTQEILQLSDLNRVESLVAPIVSDPGTELEALESWLRDFGELERRLPDHRRALEGLRTRAGARSTGERADVRTFADTVLDEWGERLKFFRAARDRASAEDSVVPQVVIADLESEIDLFERTVAAWSSLESPEDWLFPDEVDQWRHDILARIVADTTALGDSAAVFDREINTRGTITRRLECARDERCRFEAALPEWDTAIRSIANPRECPQYAGLVISPQPGLVPLGRDPDSGLWEFLHLTTGEAPRRDPAWHVVPDPDFGVVLVLIPGGTDLLGAQSDDESAPNYDARKKGHEGPVHEVTLDPYFISKFEMTHGQWWRATHRHPAVENRGRSPLLPVRPANGISWYQATRDLPRMGLELPTEAQWEFAARAGTDTPTWAGSSDPAGAGLEDDHAIETDEPDVGSFAPNPFGLYDVLGSVGEWCREASTPDLATSHPRLGDGLRPSSPGAGVRVSRGHYSAARVQYAPDRASVNNGVRPVRRLLGGEP